jgi:hypothetical protein
VHRALVSSLLSVALLAMQAPTAATASSTGARAALLSRSDLGAGWSVAAAPARPVPQLTCPRFHPRTTGMTETSSAASPSFERGASGPFVSQTAYAYASAGAGQEAWRVLARAKLIDCIAASLTGASSDGVSFAVTSMGPLTLPRLRTRAIGYNVTASATSSEVPTAVYLDDVLLGRGATISELSVTSFSRQESAALAARLARLIADRLELG